MITISVIILSAYLIGSIPTGFVFCKLIKGIDIRSTGSKSIGATNVMRLLGPKNGVSVLLIDFLKGLVATIFISQINFGDLSISPEWLKALTGFMAVVGHIFPVWIGFKGGKGVATGAGLLVGMLPLEIGFALIIFAATVALTRYISLGSILAVIFVFMAISAQQFILHITVHPAQFLVALILLLTVLLTHRQNILRLIKREERKFGQKRE